MGGSEKTRRGQGNSPEVRHISKGCHVHRRSAAANNTKIKVVTMATQAEATARATIQVAVAPAVLRFGVCLIVAVAVAVAVTAVEPLVPVVRLAVVEMVAVHLSVLAAVKQNAKLLQ